MGTPTPSQVELALMTQHVTPSVGGRSQRGGRGFESHAAHHPQPIQYQHFQLHRLPDRTGEHPAGYRYSQFCEIYRRWARTLRPSMRQVHRAGEKTFIDFSGTRPHLRDRRTGEQIPVELFVAALGASSFTYAEAVESQQLPCWVGAHLRMVDDVGGSTEVWVPDQLKSGVTGPSRYEPGINRTYQETGDRRLATRAAPRHRATRPHRSHRRPRGAGLDAHRRPTPRPGLARCRRPQPGRCDLRPAAARRPQAPLAQQLLLSLEAKVMYDLPP